MLLFLLHFFLQVHSEQEFSTPFQCPNCIELSVGPAIYVGGPVGNDFDNPFIALNVSGTIRGYSANAETYLVVDGTSLDSVIEPIYVGLGFGDSSSDLDYCGAWLNAAAIDPTNPTLIHGWYHEEWKCDYAENFYTNKSIAYAESSDGGKTFSKTAAYPNNQIIVPPLGNTTTEHQCGEGDHGVTQFKDNYYLYFLEWDGPNGETTIGLARSLISSGGKPGTWYKYYNGDFTEPGLGGNSSMIRNVPGTAVYYRPELMDFIAVGIDGASDSDGEPFMGMSDDGINWSRMTEPILHVSESDWNRSGTPGELVAYVGFTSTGGNYAIGNDIWFYYTYLQPNEDFSQRYLVKRHITMTFHSAPITTPKVHVALTSYQNSSDSWATTTMIPPAFNYKTLATLGTLLTNGSYSNTVKLFDCFITDWSDHMVGMVGECGPGLLKHYGVRDEPVFLLGDVTVLRVLGWIWNQAIGNAKPLYRCWNAEQTDHAVSLLSNCSDLGSGYVQEFQLGYIDPYVE